VVSYAFLALVAVHILLVSRNSLRNDGFGRLNPLDKDKITIVLEIPALHISLICISLASVRAILLYKRIVSGLNPFKDLQKVVRTSWRLKGDFAILVLLGYVITPLLGTLYRVLNSRRG